MEADLEIRQLLAQGAIEYAVEELDKLDELPDKFDEHAYAIGEEALEYWRTAAGTHLNTTRKRYQDSLSVFEDFSDGSVVVMMNESDPLVVNIEQGIPPYSMNNVEGSARKIIPIQGWTDMRIMSAGDNKWQHPGFRGLKLVEETDKYIQKVLIPKHMTQIFEEL